MSVIFEDEINKTWDVKKVEPGYTGKGINYSWLQSLFGVLAGVGFFVAIGYYVWHSSRDRVEQEFRSSQFVTYVWVDGQIAKSWYDPTDSLLKYPSLKAQRKQEAEIVLAKLKGTYKMPLINVDTARQPSDKGSITVTPPTDTVIHWGKFTERMNKAIYQSITMPTGWDRLTDKQRKEIIKRWRVTPDTVKVVTYD